MNKRLASEQVIVSAPMSFAGSARRIWKTPAAISSVWIKIPVACLAVLAVLVAWALVAGWYLLFGVMLVPFRIVRRGSRKRKRDELRHRELLNASKGR